VILREKEKILLSFLGFVFVAQIVTYGVAINYCMRNGGLRACPEIGERGQAMFAGMTATTLALLTGIQINRKDQ